MIKMPVQVRSDNNNTHNSNIIHLARFAPSIRLGAHQVFKVRAGPRRGAGATQLQRQDRDHGQSDCKPGKE